MFDVYLSVGGNLGDREKMLADAIALIDEKIGTVKKQSAIYETKAWGNKEQPDFLNMAVLAETDLLPEEVLKEISEIEQKLGRKRLEHWGTRLIDIDILFYGNKIINLSNLIIPHRYLAERNFVLVPLNEIAPKFTHPVLKKTVNDLYKNSTDVLSVVKYKNKRDELKSGH